MKHTRLLVTAAVLGLLALGQQPAWAQAAAG